MERLPPEVFDTIGSFCDFALDEIKIWPGGRPRRKVSSISRAIAANFYDSILKQTLACMELSWKTVPIWGVMTDKAWELRLHLESISKWEDEECIDELYEEWDFWCSQALLLEIWWHENPNRRAEIIVYKPPVRIGAVVTP